jgi:hypothetical protein
MKEAVQLFMRDEATKCALDTQVQCAVRSVPENSTVQYRNVLANICREIRQYSGSKSSLSASFISAGLSLHRVTMYSSKCLLAVLVALTFSSSKLSDALPPTTHGMQWTPVDALTDEFDSESLDASKWSCDNTGKWSGRLPSQFVTENAWVLNGYLHLRNTVNKRYSYLSNPDVELGRTRAYTTHWIDSAKVYATNRIAQPGWYYETRMKASDSAMSSSFWFRMSSFSEIDVIEHIGHATKSEAFGERKAHEYAANTWVFGKYADSDEVERPVKSTISRRGRDDFADYGMHWVSPSLLVFYYNGEEVMRTVPQQLFDENLTMIFDTETLYSHGNGLPTIESLNDRSRNTMMVDWVHTYRLAPVE